MDEKESVIGTVISPENMNQIGYHRDFKIENRYSVLSEEEEDFSHCDRRKQFKLGGATTLINANSEALALTNIQDNQDGVAPPGEGEVPTSEREEEVSTWTKVINSRHRRGRSRGLQGLDPQGPAPDPFLMLPDELVLMIIKKAAELDDTGHAIIVDVIPYISARFNRLAKVKSLWHGRVNINFGPAHYSVEEKEQKLKMIIQNHLGPGVKSLSLKTGEHEYISCSEERLVCFCAYYRIYREPKPKLTAKDMIAMAVQCPNLKKLHIRWFELEVLPALENPWNLEHMSLDNIDLPAAGTFNNTEIHVSLPKLRVFEMHHCRPEMPEMPDMTKCKKLEEVCLFGTTYELDNMHIRNIYYECKYNRVLKLTCLRNSEEEESEEETPYRWPFNLLPAGMFRQRTGQVSYCYTSCYGDLEDSCGDYYDDCYDDDLSDDRGHDDVYDDEFYRTRHITREMLLNL